MANIKEVIEEERAAIQARRKRKWPGNKEMEQGDRLIGLALSGGGIRSAATNLGVLQGLAERGILSRVDYLSTVSGGGYIGACLTSLLSNKKPVKEPPAADACARKPYCFDSQNDQALFSTEWKDFPFRQDKIDYQAPAADNNLSRMQLDHIRMRASYLTPYARHFSPNVMRAVGAVFSSTFMSLLWFTLLILIITSSYMTIIRWVAPDLEMQSAGRAGANLAFNVQTADSSLSFTANGGATEKVEGKDAFKTLSDHAKRPFEKFIAIEAGQRFQLGFSTFGLGACLLLLAVQIPSLFCQFEERYFQCLIKYIGVLLLVLVSGLLFPLRIGQGQLLSEGAILVLPSLFACGALAGAWLAYVLSSRNEQNWSISRRSHFHKLTGMLLLGLLLALFCAVLPGFLAIGMDAVKALLLVITGAGIRYAVASNGRAGRKKPGVAIPAKFKGWLLGLCTVAFVFLAVVLAGNGLRELLQNDGSADTYLTWQSLPLGGLVGVAAVTIALLLAFTWLVDANKISPHYFYRDRLAEAFLKTDRPRHGLLRDDTDMELIDLHGNTGVKNCCAARGPYLLMNATLNLTTDQDLKAFNRKSDIFTFSRLFVGSPKTGYIRTEDYRIDDEKGFLKLARAMAISGAAVTSVMGMNTSLATSFACTIFGVRLGYWLPNFSYKREEQDEADPSSKEIDKKLEDTGEEHEKEKLLAPRTGAEQKLQNLHTKNSDIYKTSFQGRFSRLFKELTGHTDTAGEEIYLSDGGHSGDNLGIIPLLQRRVKLLIVSDSESDPDHTFDSFNSSLRNAFVDEGIRVEISLDGLRTNDKGLTPDKLVVGRIYYPDQSKDQKNWLVLYKNTMTGDEIAPIVNYKEKSPEFPHESTGDQFFTEEQFESYRALGRFAVYDSLASKESWEHACEKSGGKGDFRREEAFAFLTR